MFPHDIVRDIDDVAWFLGLPEVVVVVGVDCRAEVVHEAGQELFLGAGAAQDAEEVAAHVLAGLGAVAEVVVPGICAGAGGKGLLELLHAVVVGDRLVLLVRLGGDGGTLGLRRGRPRALSVLGLMSVPGG